MGVKDLLPHNAKAADAVLKAFETERRAAVVHPTGTGKSYIIAAVAERFKCVLIVAPNNFVLEETRKVCHSGCEFRTYPGVMIHPGEGNRYDLIVLDEFHRGGAEKWEIGVQKLIEANPNAKLLGTSATNIRYLDGARNMADELFDGNVVSYMSLRQAINEGILPNPTYVSSIYSIDETKKSYRKRVLSSRKKDVNKDELLRHIEGIAHNWENAGGVPAIIRKYISHDMQRIIVFCSKVKRAAEAREILGKWFGIAGFNKVRYYNIDYKERRLEKEMEDFQRPLDDYDLKVAISVNMLNEGVHIPHVDGIIMLRSTISRIIIEQQVGRCLTARAEGITPVVLDLVNNMDSIQYDEPVFLGDFEIGEGLYEKHGNSGFPFNVIDECKDLRILLEQLDNQLRGYTKEECHAEALKYTRRTDFKKNSYPYYKRACNMGWLEEITSHMPIRELNLTLEECREIAKQYKSKADFFKQNYSVYSYSYKHKWLDEICSCYPPLHTEEEFMKALKECPTMKLFHMKYPALLVYAQRRKWPCLNLLKKRKIIYRTDEDALETAWKYTSYHEFKEKEHSTYEYFVFHKKMNLLKEVFGDQIKFCASLERPLTYDYCKEIAGKCKSRTEMNNKYERVYKFSTKNGWLDDFFPPGVTYNGRRTSPHTREEFLKAARSCKDRHEFIHKFKGLYNSCIKLGLKDELDEILPIRRNKNNM